MAQQVFKFISLPSQLLARVGLGNHHMHMLRDELGINYFPPETVAIGTGLIGDNGYIDGISFDFGDSGGKQHAMDQLQGWALENGYTLGSHIHDIYKSAAYGDWSDAVAFAWLGGKLHLGQNHPAILQGVLGLPNTGGDPGDGSDTDWGRIFDYAEQPGAIFGYIFPTKKAIEIYSDFYDSNYDQTNLKTLLVQLRKRWTINEITYGPDEQTTQDMKEFFDDPRQARLALIDKYLKT
jgi:hypothetical protein